jgi:hypothetical protein
MNWIFLNKKNSDEYIEMFARGCKTVPTCLETWRYEDSADPLVIRGIMKKKIIKQCWQDKRPFRYMDTGYLGNSAHSKNPNGWKLYHRIVNNNLQHDQVIARPSDRWDQLGLQIQSRQHGSKILVVAPDEKPCRFYDIDLTKWLEETVATIKKHTDRDIIIRERNPDRKVRKNDKIENALNDVHAVVTYNSIAGTEAVLAGVPVFAMAPCNAAIPVSNTDLSQIDTPRWPTDDERHAWACHLAYGQFHVNELRNGTAWRILQETSDV